jgi:hypothetical protein
VYIKPRWQGVRADPGQEISLPNDIKEGVNVHVQGSSIAFSQYHPTHESCDCGYCRRQARQEVTHNDQLTEADALASRWHPKAVASARSIRFNLSLRIELCTERFANRYSSFPRSRSTVNGRVEEAAGQANLTG